MLTAFLGSRLPMISCCAARSNRQNMLSNVRKLPLLSAVVVLLVHGLCTLGDAVIMIYHSEPNMFYCISFFY